MQLVGGVIALVQKAEVARRPFEPLGDDTPSRQALPRQIHSSLGRIYLETSSGSPRKHVTGPETTSSHQLICGDAPFVDSSHKSGAGTPDTPLCRSPGMPRRMLSIRPRPSPFQLPPCRCRAAGQRHSAVPDSAEVDRLNRAFDGDDSVRRHTRRNFSPHRRLRQPCTGIHRLTVTYFSSISMLAAFRRHLDGKTRRNVCYSVVTQIPFFCTLMIMWTFFLN